MRWIPRADPTIPRFGVRQMPDAEYVCPICRSPVYWPEEEAGWDADNQICHAECMRKEKLQ